MSKTVSFTPQLAAEYDKLWRSARVKANAWKLSIDRAAKFAVKHRARYDRVSRRCGGVPWELIAALHWRESAGSFKRHLHNGDPLTSWTVRVPRGRPDGIPPFTWEESALDALKLKRLHLVRDWSDARICYEAERFNGFGYRLYRGHLSPYLWSGTQHYTRGKYVSDGTYSYTAVDKQVGVVPLIKRIRELAAEQFAVENSRKLTLARRIINSVYAFFSTILSLFTLDNLGYVQEWFALGNLFDPKLMIVLGIAGLVVYGVVKTFEKLTLEDYKAGRYTPSGCVNCGEDDDAPDSELAFELVDRPLNEDGWGSPDEADEGEPDSSGDRGGSAEGGSREPRLPERPADRPAESGNSV